MWYAPPSPCGDHMRNCFESIDGTWQVDMAAEGLLLPWSRTHLLHHACPNRSNLCWYLQQHCDASVCALR
jgi:hypothetical protein